MTYRPIDRSFSGAYLQKQQEAIRWLYEHGLELEEIQTFNWGNVVETEKILRITRPVVTLRANMATGEVAREVKNREITLPLSGTDQEWFFIKSRIYCHWVFLKEKPRTWRREGSKESLYSLPDIQNTCGKLRKDFSLDPLTNAVTFDTIKVVESEHYKDGNRRGRQRKSRQGLSVAKD